MELDCLNTEEKKQNDILLRMEESQKQFEGYYFDNDHDESIRNKNSKTVAFIK